MAVAPSARAPQTAPDVLVAHAGSSQRARIFNLLTAAGYNVVACATAADAPALMAIAPRAALVIGAELEDMDGIALMRAARDRGHMPIIVIAARPARIAAAVDALREGAHDYLLEPIDERLTEAVRTALRAPA